MIMKKKINITPCSTFNYFTYSMKFIPNRVLKKIGFYGMTPVPQAGTSDSLQIYAQDQF